MIKLLADLSKQCQQSWLKNWLQTIFLIWVAVFLLFPLSVFAGKKDILVIESYHGEYPWDISYKKGLENALGARYNLIYFEMDTKRLSVESHEHRSMIAFKRFNDIQPALVILGDDNALKHMGPKLANTQS